ncbi:hypothetical protein F5Y16DRAFT_367028 [Xylariaceae sp. FL0255]|nr:hypothetical protein F5Y16DRAFT_367028 [Xylariaceae sp. FL0255]
MSTDKAPGALHVSSEKTRRVLACIACQQRKVRCDRQFPCNNCLKVGAKCVPATAAPRRRRRMFPERELLERLRKYEKLLHRHDVEFEPLRSDPDAEQAGHHLDSDDGDAVTIGEDALVHITERISSCDDFWRGVAQARLDSDSECDIGDPEGPNDRSPWTDLSLNGDHLLFANRNTTVDLSSLHPDPARIFRIWQIYLDNVDPLLKLTHAPTFQRHVIENAERLSKAGPSFEAMLFAIYSISINSVDTTYCHVNFGASKSDLLSKYHFGCQQALLNCRFLRTSNRDVLTAYLLYLASVWSETHPRSLSSMFSIAVRIAERMNICHEATCANSPLLEGELQRRLWWSIKQFDSRVSEIADQKPATLGTSWDCRIPLNVNDVELGLEMASSAVSRTSPTETLFVVVRGMLSDFTRSNTITFSFNSPELRHIMSSPQPAVMEKELAALEKTIENQYLQHCDANNSLHFMTIFFAREQLAKYWLVANFLRHASEDNIEETSEQRDAALLHAIEILHCNTKLMTSPLSRGFMWFTCMNFPFSAYIHILQELRHRPLCTLAKRAWETMTDDYDARFSVVSPGDGRLFDTVSKYVLRAWSDIEKKLLENGKPCFEPRMVSDIKSKCRQGSATKSATTGTPMEGAPASMRGFDAASHPMSFDLFDHDHTDQIEMGVFTGLDLQQEYQVDHSIEQGDWASLQWMGQ